MRFYGGSVQDWSTVAAPDLFDLHALSYRMEAEERIARIVDAGCASGYADKGHIQRHAAALERMAAGTPAAEADPLAQLEAVGFKVERMRADG